MRLHWPRTMIVCARCWGAVARTAAGRDQRARPAGGDREWVEKRDDRVRSRGDGRAACRQGRSPHRAGRGRTPAVLIEVTRGGRTATTALGVESGDRRVGEIPADLRGRLADQDDDGPRHPVVEEGLIDLDARAADYLPGSVIAGIANAGTATVRQLLAMRSGIPSHFADPDVIYEWLEDHPGQEFGLDQALAIARAMPATNAPGPPSTIPTPLPAAGADDRGGDRAKLGHGAAGSSLRAGGHARFDGAAVRPRSAAAVELPSRWRHARRRHRRRLVSARRKRRGLDDRGPDRPFSALMIDGRLLSDAMLDEMLAFVPTGSGGSFGLGISATPVSGTTHYGFAGGTLGTSSVTLYDPANGIIVSMAGTLKTSTPAPRPSSSTPRHARSRPGRRPTAGRWRCARSRRPGSPSRTPPTDLPCGPRRLADARLCPARWRRTARPSPTARSSSSATRPPAPPLTTRRT